MKSLSRSLPRIPLLLVTLVLACLPVTKVFALISAPLTPPSNLAAKIASTTEVTLTWSASPNALTYYVMRSANGGPWQRVAVTGLTRFEDHLLAPDTAYSYSVYGEERNSVGSRFTSSIQVSSRTPVAGQ